MNKLPIHKKVQIINLLVEGCSMRATARIADVTVKAVVRLLVATGKACEKFHNEKVIGLTSKKVQCDEIWSFISSKEKNTSLEMKEKGAGDVWTWVGIDADSKLVVSWMIGDRSAVIANAFMHDIAARVSNRLQLTTDGYRPYMEAVTDAFGSQIDYAQLVKLFGGSTGESMNERKYSPAECSGIIKNTMIGNPDEKDISTSYIERQNLTMRMHMRRFTRLTNAFSKKIENHAYAIALHFVYYNFVKIHQTLRVPPAMEAGLIKRLMTIEDIVRLIQEEKPNRPASYKRKV